MRKINTMSLNKMRKIKNIKDKKAEVTTQQLVTIIILIVSFVVILFFIFRLNLKATTDKEICHNSVVMKSMPGIKVVTKLNCKTNYVCISGGGKCEEISATTTVKVNPNSKEEIMKAIADEMADCWWMFGEGEYDYVGKWKDFVGDTACTICSIVDFDDKIESTYPNGITYKEFLDNLTNPMNEEGEETYLYYIYGVSNVNSLLNDYSSIKEDYDSGKKISLKGKYMIRTGMAKPGFFGGLIKIFTFREEKEGKEETINMNYILPYFFKTDEIHEPQCDEFLTES